MNQEEKLKKQAEVQLGRLCEEWFDKVGRDFLENEKKQILKDLKDSMPNELIAVQARYKALLSLTGRLNSIVLKKNSSAKKLQEETGGDNRGN